MKLRKKTFLFTALSLALVTTVILAVFRFAAMRSFDQMEVAEATREVKRVHKLLQFELDDLRRWAVDYGACDELSLSIEKNELDALVRASAAHESLSSLRWSCFALVNNDRQVLAAGTMSAEQTLRPLQGAILDELVATSNSLVAKTSGADSGSQRLALIGGQPHMVVEAPIRPLAGKDRPSNGVLIVARRLDEQELERLSRIADSPVSFLPPVENKSGAVQNSRDQAAEGQKIFLTYDQPGHVTANEMITEASGRQVGVLRVTLDREIRAEGLWFTLVLMGVVIVGEVLVYFLIDRLLLRKLIARLAQLGVSLGDVHRSGNLAARLEAKGDDEITALEFEINHLLMSVESAQRTLERTNAEMQQRVAERTTALAAANTALEADIAERIKAEQEREGLREQLIRSSKMEAVGTLAGGIAHDFNNILAGILGHVQLVDSDLPADHPSRANLRQVIAASERATTLVHQILSFSRQTPGERRRVSVGKIAREALSLLRAALPSTISIKCDVEAVVDMVDADPTQLHQVFMNLGANAGHAMGTRAGELTIKIANARPGEWRTGVTNPLPAGDYLCIEVKDTGCGMSHEVIKRIFDPFFSTKPVNEGTGLGLAVVHGIVTDHGGTIQVESEPGKGTVFRIMLPAAADNTVSSASHHALPLRGTERILIVDDEELVLGVLAQGLDRLGYMVTVDSFSPQALGRFQKTPNAFDLVITDQTMPQMSGLELSIAIHAVRPEIPIIIITGFSPQLNGKTAQSLGVAGILGKPIDFGELSTLMRTELNAARSRTG